MTSNDDGKVSSADCKYIPHRYGSFRCYFRKALGCIPRDSFMLIFCLVYLKGHLLLTLIFIHIDMNAFDLQ